jgi:hypothetical protein
VPGNNVVARRGVIKNLGNENISSIIKICQTVQRNKNKMGKKREKIGLNWPGLDVLREPSSPAFMVASAVNIFLSPAHK